MQARGFLIGATSGRTTLNGEGLQHEDGHSQIMAGNVPNCVSYDPTFSYELMVILKDGMQRMFKKQENVFYYITTMNENYPHPALSKGQEKDIVKGMYLFQKGKKGKT
jgi:pyruvate dehydrogenase E1 component